MTQLKQLLLATFSSLHLLVYYWFSGLSYSPSESIRPEDKIPGLICDDTHLL